MSRMQNFFDQFAWAADRHAGRTAIEVQHKDHLEGFAYARLREMAERTAAWLAVIGIGPGERCAILADNDAHWCAAYSGSCAAAPSRCRSIRPTRHPR